MITINVYRHNESVQEITCSGHAGYAEEGHDIVCSAVSALTAALANGLESTAKVPCQITDDGKTVRCALGKELTESQKHDAAVLFDTYVGAISQIRSQYSKYLRITDRRV